MAKSNGFFTLRRGSTKSLTFQVMDGKQITKDRVSKVSNPKTQRQQFQRAIMATIMAAYSAMKPICDHSFQGKKKGAENQREFMSKNLNAMRAALVSYDENVTPETQQNFMALGPKVPTILPNAFIISSGSLADSKFMVYDDSNHTIKLPEVSSLPVEINDNTTTANLGEVADFLGLYPGLQITFCCITCGAGSRIFEVYSEDYAGYWEHEFGYARFIVKNFDRTQTLTATGTNALRRIVIDAINAVVDPRTSPSLKGDNWLEMNLVNDIPTIDAEILLESAGFDESLTGAIGKITSHVDEDLRSKAQMLVRNRETQGACVGLAFDFIWDAWKNSGSLGESEKYLEGGNV